MSNTASTIGKLEDIASNSYNWVKGEAAPAAPPAPAAPKPPEGAVPAADFQAPIKAKYGLPASVDLNKPLLDETNSKQNPNPEKFSQANQEYRDYLSRESIKAKYGLPSNADLSKPLLDPANRAVKDPYKFSQAYQEYHSGPKKSLAARAIEATGVTQPWEGAMAPRTAEELVAPAEYVGADIAGEIAAPYIKKVVGPVVGDIAENVRNWRLNRDATAAAEAEGKTITLKPGVDFREIGGTTVKPAPEPVEVPSVAAKSAVASTSVTTLPEGGFINPDGKPERFHDGEKNHEDAAHRLGYDGVQDMLDEGWVRKASYGLYDVDHLNPATQKTIETDIIHDSRNIKQHGGEVTIALNGTEHTFSMKDFIEKYNGNLSRAIGKPRFSVSPTVTKTAAESSEESVKAAGGTYRGTNSAGLVEITLPRSMTNQLPIRDQFKDFVSVTMPANEVTPKSVKAAMDKKFTDMGGTPEAIAAPKPVDFSSVGGKSVTKPAVPSGSRWVETSPDEYQAALAKNPHAATLTAYKPEELQNHQVFELKTPDNTSTGIFYNISPEGEAGGLINNGPYRGAVSYMTDHAPEHGATRATAWDVNGQLPDLYKSHGMTEAGVAPYDVQQYGEPSENLKNAWKSVGWKNGDQYPGVWEGTFPESVDLRKDLGVAGPSLEVSAQIENAKRVLRDPQADERDKQIAQDQIDHLKSTALGQVSKSSGTIVPQSLREDIHHEMGHILVADRYDIGTDSGIWSMSHPEMPEGSIAAVEYDFTPWSGRRGLSLVDAREHEPELITMLMAGGAGEETTGGTPMIHNQGMRSDKRAAHKILSALGYTSGEINAKLEEGMIAARRILRESGAPDIMKEFSASREEGLPHTHHMSQKRAEELKAKVRARREEIENGTKNAVGNDVGSNGAENLGGNRENVSRREGASASPAGRSVSNAANSGRKTAQLGEPHEQSRMRDMSNAGETPAGGNRENVARGKGAGTEAPGRETAVKPVASKVAVAEPEEDESFGFGANAPELEQGAYHPDLQKLIGDSKLETSPPVGASFITPDGKFVRVVDHPTAIERATGERPEEDAKSLGEKISAGLDPKTDSRVRFLNDTGAVRVRISRDQGGETAHISVPKQGVTEDEISSIRQAIAKVGRYGNLVMERADVTPETVKELSMTKEFPSPADVDSYLKQIQAHPDKTAPDWSKDAAQAAAKSSAGGWNPITGKTSEAVHPETGEPLKKPAGLEYIPESRMPLDHVPTQADFDAFYEKNKDVLNSRPGLAIGWDNESNVPGGHELNIAAAGEGGTKVARKLDQRAAWDIRKGGPISTGGEGLRTEFPNYPEPERWNDLHNLPQSNIPGFERVPERLYNLMNDDIRDYLAKDPKLQQRVVDAFHNIDIDPNEAIHSVAAGADANGWWRRFIDVHNRIGEAGSSKTNKYGVKWGEILKAWNSALSGNKRVDAAANLSYGSFYDWLKAGQPTDRVSIDNIIRNNGANVEGAKIGPTGEAKKGNTAISDTHGPRGKLLSSGLDTDKLWKLVNSPQMRGEKPFGGKIYTETSPVEAKGAEARKIPSMAATVAGEGNLRNAVLDSIVGRFMGRGGLTGTEAQYIAETMFFDGLGQRMGIPTGESQEQIWTATQKFLALMDEGLTPDEATDRIIREGTYDRAKDYSDILLSDKEISGKGGYLDKLKNEFGIGPGSEGFAELHGRTKTAQPSRESTAGPIDRTLLAKTGRRIQGTLSERRAARGANRLARSKAAAQGLSKLVEMAKPASFARPAKTQK